MKVAIAGFALLLTMAAGSFAQAAHLDCQASTTTAEEGYLDFHEANFTVALKAEKGSFIGRGESLFANNYAVGTSAIVMKTHTGATQLSLKVYVYQIGGAVLGYAGSSSSGDQPETWADVYNPLIAQRQLAAGVPADQVFPYYWESNSAWLKDGFVSLNEPIVGGVRCKYIP